MFKFFNGEFNFFVKNLATDTDELWKKLCGDKFKVDNAIPDEDETWRELYFVKLLFKF